MRSESTMGLYVGIALLWVTLITSSGIVSAQSASAERGKDLYYAHGCYGCHGYNGETGARDLVATNSPLIENLETFVLFLRLRGDYLPLLPSTRMPAYPESALSDADARDIYAYVSSFELDAPEIETVPAFREILESAATPLEN